MLLSHMKDLWKVFLGLRNISEQPFCGQTWIAASEVLVKAHFDKFSREKLKYKR